MENNRQIDTTIQTAIIFCLYARKSSESDERQAMSIESQVNEMTKIAERDNLYVKETLKESHSAKTSGMRPIFNQLLAGLRSGRFNAILTWAPDRLSRNAGDLGMLVDLMDANRLVQIKTFSTVFSNNPNEKFLLMILCSQAKLENDNKSVNVRRGIRNKCEMGWRPGSAPLGYMNRSFGGIRDIIVDKERALIVREVFEKVAYMYHSGRMAKVFMDKSGFTTKTGKKITLSMIYLMLRNSFYYGKFEFPEGSGKWYKGAHEPIITKEVFDDVQTELGVPRVYKWGNKVFAFKGIFKCYNCGSGVVGEEKLRKLKYGGTRRHVYYHCSRTRDHSCKEPYLEERDLIKYLNHFIDNMDEKDLHIPEKTPRGFDGISKARKRHIIFQNKYDR